MIFLNTVVPLLCGHFRGIRGVAAGEWGGGGLMYVHFKADCSVAIEGECIIFNSLPTRITKIDYCKTPSLQVSEMPPGEVSAHTGK